MYQKLINDYENLSETEKNALRIYKSRIGRAINDIENQKEVETIYENYKKMLNDPKNIFLNLTVFQDIALETKETFLESIKRIKTIVEETTNKLALPENTTVYRIFSIPKETTAPSFLAKDNLISTSLKIENCLPFIIKDQGYEHYLYQISMQKGDPVAIIPYAILLNRKENQLILSKRTDQEEILISKQNFDFEVEEEIEKILPNGETIHFIACKAKRKDFEKTIPEKRAFH